MMGRPSQGITTAQLLSQQVILQMARDLSSQSSPIFTDDMSSSVIATSENHRDLSSIIANLSDCQDLSSIIAKHVKSKERFWRENRRKWMRYWVDRRHKRWRPFAFPYLPSSRTPSPPEEYTVKDVCKHEVQTDIIRRRPRCKTMN